jgi:hypothetical protein
MVVLSIVAAIDKRHPQVNKFIQFTVKRPAHGRIESQKLEHLGTMSRCFLHVAGFAADVLS